jgi:hypothetical protein
VNLFNSSYPPGASGDHRLRHLGNDPTGRHLRPMGFRSTAGKFHGHMGRTTIDPNSPHSTAPANTVARVHSLFGKAVLE